MKKFVSFIRGINVAGHKIIKMTELKILYHDLEFEDVVSYIQSGNVLFNSKINSIKKITKLIKEGIDERFGFDVVVIVKTSDQLKSIIENNPFTQGNGDDISKLHITLFNEKLKIDSAKLLIHNKPTNDKFELVNSEIYLYTPNGYGRTIYTNNFFEKRFKLKASTRTLKTFNKLYELSLNN